MQVFKAFFKVIKKNIPQMLIYFGIFMLMSLLFLSAGVGEPVTEFEGTRPPVAVFDSDNTVFTESLVGYISENASIVDIEDSEEAIRDALFFREAVYVLFIPEGFTEDFETGSISLESFKVAGSFAGTYIEQIITGYLQTFETYMRFLPDLDTEETALKTLTALSVESEIEMKRTEGDTGTADNSVFYFNFFAYSLLAIILLGVCAFMLTFQKSDLRRRNQCSPVKHINLTLQLIAGNFIFAVLVWGIMFFVSFILFGMENLSPKAFHYGVNTVVYTMVCLSLSFMISGIVKSKDAQAAVVNVLSLGLSFISGVFVPQYLLGETVRRIASFAPTYWFVRANLKINETPGIRSEGLGIISSELIMQIVFIAVFLIVAIISIRHKRTSEN